MRQLHLVNDLEFNKKYKERNGEKDYNSFSYMIENSYRTLYEADELVQINEDKQNIIEKVVAGYIDLFTKRNLIPTEAQIEFARTTAKVLLGELINVNSIPVIPAPCGFGKSTITYIFMKEICHAIKEGILEDGLILVTDKLEQLKEFHKNLSDEIGCYKVETFNGKEYETSFTYVLEGWTENSYKEGVCLNSKFKSYKRDMCTKAKCPFFGECTISKQANKQKYSPILLMTNARLESFEEHINSYGYYINENAERKQRTLLINDEKPKMIDSISVSISLVNDIQNEIYGISVSNDNDKQEKLVLRDKWKKIRSVIESKLNNYSNYERMIISNINNEPILLNDEQFMELWDKHMGIKYRGELKHIHRILTKGGLYCNTKKQGVFINTISMRNILNDNFKTVIFDATALVDTDYASSEGCVFENLIKFVDIENVRTFNNVTFHFYQSHKINKSQFRSKNYLVDACVKFLETLDKDKPTYIVTYNEVAPKMLKEIEKNNKIIANEIFWGVSNKVSIVTYDDDTLFYFGNTKGSNKAKDCTQMVQFGWNTLPDYIYATKYLCTNFPEEKMNEIFNKCADTAVAERFSEYLMHGEEYNFSHNPNLYLYQYYAMATDFIQEVFRTKLRNYNTNSKIDVHCFRIDRVLIEMVKQLFPNCKVKVEYDEVACFLEEKVVNRKNGDKAKILKEFIDNDWEIGKEISTKDICESTGLTTGEIDNLKRKNNYFKALFDKYKVKRGKFIKSQ